MLIWVLTIFEQPDVTVVSYTGTYTKNGFPVPTSYTIHLTAHCTIKNMDDRSAEIDEVDYIPTIEGQVAEHELYSDTYPGTTISINAGETLNMDLPVTLNLNNVEGASLVSKLQDGTADYIIDGTFHTLKVDGASNVFQLPLYETGSVPITSFTQE